MVKTKSLHDKKTRVETTHSDMPRGPSWDGPSSSVVTCTVNKRGKFIRIALYVRYSK